MLEHEKFAAPSAPDYPTREEVERGQDQELRRHCIGLALQIEGYGVYTSADRKSDLGTVLIRADRLFNYIKTGAK